MITSIVDFIHSYGLIYLIRDGIEITFFVILTYWVSRWLNYDSTKPLLAYFYGYNCLMILSYIAPLPVIYHFLSMGWPFFAVILVLIHQHVLQRNFISLQTTTTPSLTATDWIKEILRVSLSTTRSGKSVTWIIQRSHDLAPFIHTQSYIRAPISEQLLRIIFDSSLINPNSLIWITAQGTILGVNALWDRENKAMLLHEDTDQEHTHTVMAMSVTKYNDALVFIAQPSETFDIIIQGKAMRNVPSQAMLRYLKNYCNTVSQDPHQEIYYKGTDHAQEKQS